MRTTVTIDDDLLAAAAEFSGIADKSRLINFALDAYAKKMAARRLAALGGTMPDFDIPGRGGMGTLRAEWVESVSKVAEESP
ncbi:MAG: type II toxin-antitoxin system VapB family antitoxin [Verrucomicrobiota bacterium]